MAASFNVRVKLMIRKWGKDVPPEVSNKRTSKVKDFHENELLMEGHPLL